MSPFFKPKILFSELEPMSQFEKIVEKFLHSEFNRHNFSKSQNSEASLSYSKIVGDFEQRVDFTLHVIREKGIMFNSTWLIEYSPYQDWHFKQYNEYTLLPEFAMWDDSSTFTSRSSKYFKSHNHKLPDGSIHEMKFFDLTKHSTHKVMDDYLEGLLRYRIPVLNAHTNWDSIIEFNLSQLPWQAFDKIFDCYILANRIEEAVKFLDEIEILFKENGAIEDEFYKRHFENRKALLKRL